MEAKGGSGTPMPRGRRNVVVGISGPDGAGKTSLVGELERRFRARGHRVATTYLYGCVFCRRAPASAELAPPRDRKQGRGERLFRLAHGLVDAFELAIRLSLARRRLGLGRGGTTGSAGVLLTDRSPLDGLVKHQPLPGSLVERLYLRLVRRFDLVLELEAPTAVLVARDAEHDAPILAVQAARHARIRAWLPQAISIATGTRTTAEVADEAEGLIRSLD